jgi:hypothetical protein
MEIKQLIEFFSEDEKLKLFSLLNNHFNENEHKLREKTDILKWIQANPYISKRLKGTLETLYFGNHNGIQYYRGNGPGNMPIVKHVEDIQEEMFLRTRNVGVKTWYEFKKFRDLAS